MARHFRRSSSQSFKFREASSDLLADFLVNLNKGNKDHLNALSACSGHFRDRRIIEYVLLMAKELALDPLAGYQAIELLQRFMVKHLIDLLAPQTPPDAAADPPVGNVDGIFEKLKEKFPLVIFSCLQLASKVSLHSQVISNDAAVCFLRSVGFSVSKQALLESELMVLKGLEFRLNVPNPLTYVETLLEVFGHNEPSIALDRLHRLCRHVLRFVSLQRTAIFDSLLVTTTQCVSPSREQRDKFVTVTEDFMLLGVGVIAVASFILYVRKWEQVVEELSHITGISRRSITDFAHAALTHIVRAPVLL
ncbi:cyclin N-terminal domain-containing protein 1 [Brachionichthys hirsutus]|uniref:cyclin N-terminal domain-containing protein 1 n=1 Tax=Brachionichthys hirsutus TaxID=412623 RepID=UPI003604A2B3